MRGIKYDIIEGKYIVSLIHNYPETLPLDLRATNYCEVQEVPTFPDMEGKYQRLIINPDTKEFTVEYIDRPLTIEEKMAKLERQNEEMSIALASILGM
jgi:hypothetical protein